LVNSKIGIDEFLRMIEENDFVEAHEVLEDEWKIFKKEEKRLEAKFVQALINGATSIALWIKKRPEPSLRVWEVFQRNKHLINEISLENKDKYLNATILLEMKFSIKHTL